MKIKWKNIFAMAIFLGVIIFLFKLPKLLDRLPYMRMPDYFDDPVIGLFFFGMICVTIVGVVKIISKR